MKQFSLGRFFLAALLILIGGLIASRVSNPNEQLFIFMISGLIALFIGSDAAFASGRTPPEDEAENDNRSIGEHPEFQQLIDASDDPILLIETSRVAQANIAARQLLGENLVGENVRTAIRHAGAAERLVNPEADHSGQPLVLTGIGRRDQNWEMRIRRLGPTQKLVHLRDRSGSQAAERMRVDFVANASHELRTPLASVKGFLETLREPDAGNDEKTRSRFVQIMLNETERMQRLVGDLLSLSRIEAEKFQLPDTPIDLADLLGKTLEALRRSGDPRARDIRVDSAERMVILGDEGQLRQMIDNIVSNGMKYGQVDTPITVSLRRTRSRAMVRLNVRDEGEGIPPEHLPRLTERFYRVDSGRSRALGGTGLGLSIVKHIVERHRGHLEITSEIGVGTSVSVLLPLTQSASASAAQREN